MTTDPLIVTGSVYISNSALAVTICNVSPITVVGTTNLVTTDPLTVTGSVYISNSLISVAVTNPVAVTGSVTISNSNPLAVTGSVYIAIFSFLITNTGSNQVIDMTPLDVVIVPGETLTLAASSNDTSSNAVGGFSWIENT